VAVVVAHHTQEQSEVAVQVVVVLAQEGLQRYLKQ
jgi:hypothetical protein